MEAVMLLEPMPSDGQTGFAGRVRFDAGEMECWREVGSGWKFNVNRSWRCLPLISVIRGFL